MLNTKLLKDAWLEECESLTNANEAAEWRLDKVMEICADITRYEWENHIQNLRMHLDTAKKARNLGYYGEIKQDLLYAEKRFESIFGTKP